MEKKKEISLSAVALSSRYVMEKISPIIYATVHEDGVWEFWGKEIIDESEILVVTIKQVLDIDPSIEGILQIETGIAAVRNTPKEPWQFTSDN
jgi:hypothetical protein